MQLPIPLPPGTYQAVNSVGYLTQVYALYLASVDTFLRLVGGNNAAGAPQLGPLTNAANDAAAAAAGVPVNALYRNGSVVQIRVT